MRIIYVTVVMPFGAQEAFLIPEVRELLQQRQEVHLVPRSSRKTVFHNDAQSLTAITSARRLCSPRILRAAGEVCARWPGRVLAALRSLRDSRNLRTLIKNVAVVPKALWLADLAMSHGAEHIHAHWALTTATMAMIASRVSGIPWSFTAHRGDIVENNLLGIKARDAAFVRVISQSGLRLLESIAGSDVLDNVCVIHMGVPVPEGRCPTRMVGPVPNILCPANLLPVKGHKHLLQAVAILKRLGVNCAVDLAGDGPLRLSLQEQVADLAVSDCVTFLGQLSHDEILARYRDPALTAVVLPSVDLGNGIHEGIPVALIEAMSFGVPVISTLTGGIPELLGEGAGILVPPAEPAALANAITRVIQDSSLRTRLSLAGRDRVMREFSARSSVEALRRRFASSRAGRFEGRPGRRAA